jgi:hypothetical protein
MSRFQPFALLLLALAACSKPPQQPAAEAENRGAVGDPWAAAGAKLKRDTEPATVRAALTALNAEVGSGPGEKLPAATDAQLDALAALVPLAREDRDELRGSVFSAHDPAYLADCFYLRDCARALELDALPPDARADRAFAWVCRQVYLNPWLLPAGSEERLVATALPPTTVLRRGFGSAYERLTVFLALLQQLELDGCLIGGPTPGTLLGPFQVTVPPKATLAEAVAALRAAVPRGPFWAAGVRVGNDVRVYDPWRGAPAPVPLSQLRANPDAAKAWFADPANAGKITPEDARAATVHLAVPVNALSPRMAAFEAKLGAQVRARAAYDQKALEARRAAYPDPKPAFWNPPNEPLAYGRCARSFLPLDQGGTAAGAAGSRLYDLALHDQIPRSALQVDDRIRVVGAQTRFQNVAAGQLYASFIDPPNMRERLQRGRYADAAREAVAKQEQFSAGLERLRTQDAAGRAAEIAAWVNEVNAAYLARAAADRDPGARADAEAAIERCWKAAPARWLVDRASAEVGRAEAALVLALCKHEQAERAQTRADGAPQDAGRAAEAKGAWTSATAAWRTYEQYSSAQSGFLGRAEHAAALAARAAALAK